MKDLNEKKMTEEALEQVSGGRIEQLPDGDYNVYDDCTGELHGTFDRLEDAQDFDKQLNG
ncbi:MAG: hypothetical protein K6G83_02785 [Lachnospiraceae bacterium]|nr:hypothetical protein [Lachnospiraceae bacterium]